ncbi:MAG: hypothetical protein ABL995_09745 [Bryobacteraceae bacterium]
MKTYIRQMLDDLIPSKKPKAEPPISTNLENQTLSSDPEQRVRQLDWQAQKSEERQRS